MRSASIASLGAARPLERTREPSNRLSEKHQGRKDQFLLSLGFQSSQQECFERRHSVLIGARQREAQSSVLMRSDRPTAPVANAQNRYRVALDGEENTVHMRLVSIEQVSYLKRKRRIFGG